MSRLERAAHLLPVLEEASTRKGACSNPGEMVEIVERLGPVQGCLGSISTSFSLWRLVREKNRRDIQVSWR